MAKALAPTQSISNQLPALLTTRDSSKAQTSPKPSTGEEDLVSGLYNAVLKFLLVCHKQARTATEHEEYLLIDTSNDNEQAQAALEQDGRHQQKPTQDNSSGADRQTGARLTKVLADIAARLLLWGDAITSGKAEATAISCPELYRNIAELLGDCGKDLKRLRLAYSPDESQTWRTVTSPLESWLEKAEHVFTSDTNSIEPDGNKDITLVDAHDESDAHSISSFASDRSEAGPQALVELLDEDVSLLMDLLPSIDCLASSSQHWSYIGSVLNTRLEVSEHAQPFLRKIAKDYKDAPLQLVKRLSEANWQRFYRLSLYKGEDLVKELHQNESHLEFAPKFCHSAIGVSQSLDDWEAINSQKPSTSKEADSSHHSYRIPPAPPEAAQGKHFICPICDVLLTDVCSRNDWRLHVFQDLKPYICVFENCNHLLDTFASREAWFEHNLKEHQQRTHFKCYDCQYVSSVEADFSSHIQESHNRLNAHQRKKFLSAATRIETRRVELWECALCNESRFSTMRKFTSHVCAHMEDIALGTLPQYLWDKDTDGQSSSGSSTSEKMAKVHEEVIANGKDMRNQPGMERKDSHGASEPTIHRAILEHAEPHRPQQEIQSISSDLQELQDIGDKEGRGRPMSRQLSPTTAPPHVEIFEEAYDRPKPPAKKVMDSDPVPATSHHVEEAITATTGPPKQSDPDFPFVLGLESMPRNAAEKKLEPLSIHRETDRSLPASRQPSKLIEDKQHWYSIDPDYFRESRWSKKVNKSSIVRKYDEGYSSDRNTRSHREFRDPRPADDVTAQTKSPRAAPHVSHLDQPSEFSHGNKSIILPWNANPFTQPQITVEQPTSASQKTQVSPARKEGKPRIQRRQDKKHQCQHCGSDKAFSTSNDLDRHLKTVHGIIPEGEKVWLCQIPNCSAATKVWIRLDNFKQHVIRMHGSEFADQAESMAESYSSERHGAVETGKGKFQYQTNTPRSGNPSMIKPIQRSLSTLSALNTPPPGLILPLNQNHLQRLGTQPQKSGPRTIANHEAVRYNEHFLRQEEAYLADLPAFPPSNADLTLMGEGLQFYGDLGGSIDKAVPPVKKPYSSYKVDMPGLYRSDLTAELNAFQQSLPRQFHAHFEHIRRLLDAAARPSSTSQSRVETATKELSKPP